MTSPAYYLAGDLERDGRPLDCGDVIEALGLDYWLGSAFAHIWRAGRKPGETEVEALLNAWACLDRAVRLRVGARQEEAIERLADLCRETPAEGSCGR